jgi:DNA polymerase III delta subunit
MDFNFQSVDLMGPKESSISIEHVLDALNTAPFFSGRKFMVVENFQKMLKKDMKKIEQYLARPSETSVFILLNSGAIKKDVRESLTGVKYIVLDVSERDIPAWLKAKAKSKAIELSDNAADYLIGTIGTDLGLLSSEVDKCTFLGKTRIEKEDIMDIIEGRRKYNAFALIDAIRAGDPERVFSIYRVLRDTEEPYSLLGALNWQYAKSFGERDSPRDRKFYRDVFALLNTADVNIKSSGGVYPMELLLVKLLQLSKQR